jgi:hypothetical protein
VFGEDLAEELLQAFFRPQQTFAVRIDVSDGDRDGWVVAPPSATRLDLRPTAEDSPCLVCCPLQVDVPLGLGGIELDNVDTVDPQRRGDLDDPVPVRIPRGSAGRGKSASDLAGNPARRFALVLTLITNVQHHRCLRGRLLNPARIPGSAVSDYPARLLAGWWQPQGHGTKRGATSRCECSEDSGKDRRSSLWLRRGVRSGDLWPNDQAELCKVGEC